MGLLRRKKALIGLDLGSDTIKAIEVETIDGIELNVTGYGQIEVPSPEARADALAELVSQCGFKTKKVAIAVSGRSVIVRFLNMVDIPEDNLKNAIRYEADKYIPFDLEDVTLDCQRLENEDDDTSQMKVLLVAARRDLIEEQLSLVRDVGLDPRIVDVDAFAVGNAFRHVTSSLEGMGNRVVALVDIGASKTCINVIRNGESAFSREVYMGGNDLTSAVAKRFGLESYEAEQLKRAPDDRIAEVTDAVESAIDELGHEINLSFDYYENQCDSHVDEVYLSGGGSCFPGLDESLERIFERRTALWDPIEGVNVDEQSVDADLLRAHGPSMVVAVGLATRVNEE